MNLNRFAAKMEEDVTEAILGASTVSAATGRPRNTLTMADIARMREKMEEHDPGTLHVGSLNAFSAWVTPHISASRPCRAFTCEGALTDYRPSLYGMPVIEDKDLDPLVFFHKDRDGKIIGAGIIGKGFLWRHK